MIKASLTGSRYSGKSACAKAFSQIGVPVFEADPILKYLLNFDSKVGKEIIDRYGKYIFTGPCATISPKEIKTDGDFDRLVSFAEEALNAAYMRFLEKNAGSVYTIFHSSIVFERGWESAFDYNICAFAPKQERSARAQMRDGKNISEIERLLSSEMDPLAKNSASDFVIHAYEAAGTFGSLPDQVCSIDKKIVDAFLGNKEPLGEIYC